MTEEKNSKDKYNITFITFCLMGMAGYTQTCFFITANQYWKYKFRDVSKSTYNDTDEESLLQVKFTTYFSLAAYGPGIIINLMNMYLINKVSFNKRLFPSMTIMLLIFILTSVFVNVNTDSWQTLFFYLSVALNLLLTVVGSIATAGFFTIQAKFPSKYITSFCSGQSLGSVFSAVLQIISLFIGASEIATGNIYFSCGTIAIIVTYILLIVATKTEFFTHYVTLDKFENEEKIKNSFTWVSIKNLMKKIWLLIVGISVSLFLTIAFGPGFLVLIKSEYEHSNDWGDKYFNPVAVYLNYFIWDWIGKLLAGYFQKPKSAKAMVLIAMSRILLVPCLLFSNIKVGNDWPVYFPKDYQFIIFVALFAVSSGYLINLMSYILKDLFFSECSVANAVYIKNILL